MKRFVTIFFLIMTISIASSAQDGEKLVSKLSRDSILIGDQVVWSLPFTIKEGDELFIEEPSDPVAEGIETIKEMWRDTLSIKRGYVKLEAKSILTSFDSGSYFLPPLIAMIDHKNGIVDTLYCEGPTLEVTTVPIDTSTYEIADIKGQMRYPITFGEVAPWVLLALLVGGLIYVLARYIKYRRENRDFFGKPIVKDPPHIVALRDLEKIRGQKLWQSDKQKQFYTQVTDVLRVYMADRYSISTLERTSAEILGDLEKKGIEHRLFEEVSALFQISDMVKFAKAEATKDENESAIPTAVRFVNTTYMADIDSNKENKEE